MTKPRIKTHTFNANRVKVEFVERIEGLYDGESVMILAGNDVRALHSALHEGLHAAGFPTEAVDKFMPGEKEGVTWDVARFLWRLGWRKKEK